MKKTDPPDAQTKPRSDAQMYILATITLVVGLAAGYFLGSSQPKATSQQAAVAAQSAQAEQQQPQEQQGPMEPTQAQLRQMADKQVEPMKAQLKHAASDESLLAKIGNIYYDAHQPDVAVEYYQQVLKYNSKNISVRSDMASSYYYMGDADRAIRELQTILKSEPNHPQALFNLGMIRWKAKLDINGAMQAWERLLKNNPDYKDRARVEELMAKVRQHVGMQMPNQQQGGMKMPTHQGGMQMPPAEQVQ